MRKFIIMAAVTVIVFVMGATVHAATSITNAVTVQTSVLGKCFFNTNSATITIADIDPSSTSAVTGIATLQYACTKGGATAAITTNAGTSPGVCGAAGGALGQPLYLSDGGTGCMKYTLSAPALVANGFSAFTDEVVTATIAVVDFQDQLVGAYDDVVTLTIAY